MRTLRFLDTPWKECFVAARQATYSSNRALAIVLAYIFAGIWILEAYVVVWGGMAEWSFLTNHARALVCIAHDPGVRLRDIAVELEITERSAYSIVTELAQAGYVVKQRDGRRNRYEIDRHMPLRGTVGHERTIGEVLDILVEASAPKS